VFILTSQLSTPSSSSIKQFAHLLSSQLVESRQRPRSSMHINMIRPSALQTSTSRPATAAAAVPRFTCHALPSAFNSSPSAATGMPLLPKNPLVPSSTTTFTVFHNNRISCKYTSLPERMGDQEDNPSAAVPDANPGQQARVDGKRRQRDAADQQHATRMLHNMEAAAVQANPEDAGHRERHRALGTEDYPAPGKSSGVLQAHSCHSSQPGSGMYSIMMLHGQNLSAMRCLLLVVRRVAVAAREQQLSSMCICHE
jgi:hypothetical protein